VQLYFTIIIELLQYFTIRINNLKMKICVKVEINNGKRMRIEKKDCIRERVTKRGEFAE
jgi:hypothetical protein